MDVCVDLPPNSLKKKNEKKKINIESHINRSRWMHLLFINLPQLSGHVFGIGSFNEFTATPYAIDKTSKPLYGDSPVNNSHDKTP